VVLPANERFRTEEREIYESRDREVGSNLEVAHFITPREIHVSDRVELSENVELVLTQSSSKNDRHCQCGCQSNSFDSCYMCLSMP
jgi:hypothetical protein